MYIYSNHLYGDYYATNHELTYEELYCEECGDSDWYIGEADTPQEAFDVICEDLGCTKADEEENDKKDESFSAAPEWYTETQEYAKQCTYELFPDFQGELVVK